MASKKPPIKSGTGGILSAAVKEKREFLLKRLSELETHQAVALWLAESQPGAVATTLALAIGFNVKPIHIYHPETAFSFDKCLQLVYDIPTLKGNLEVAAGLSREWAAIIKNWQELENIHIAESGLNFTKNRTGEGVNRRLKTLMFQIQGEK